MQVHMQSDKIRLWAKHRELTVSIISPAVTICTTEWEAELEERKQWLIQWSSVIGFAIAAREAVRETHKCAHSHSHPNHTVHLQLHYGFILALA